MASKKTWKKVSKYFRPNSKIDKWGDPDEIDDIHLLRLFDFRAWLGMPIYVTAGVKKSGHAKNSWHYQRHTKRGKKIGACATDVVIPGYQWSPYDLVLDATRLGFTGIGFYPHWRYGDNLCGGLHLDSRPLKWDKDKTLNYAHSRWMGVLNEKGKQEYIAMNFHNLYKYSSYGEKISTFGTH